MPTALKFCWMICMYSLAIGSVETISAVMDSFSPFSSRMPSAPTFQPASSSSCFAFAGSYGYFMMLGSKYGLLSCVTVSATVTVPSNAPLAMLARSMA